MSQRHIKKPAKDLRKLARKISDREALAAIMKTLPDSASAEQFLQAIEPYLRFRLSRSIQA